MRNLVLVESALIKLLGSLNRESDANSRLGKTMDESFSALKNHCNGKFPASELPCHA